MYSIYRSIDTITQIMLCLPAGGTCNTFPNPKLRIEDTSTKGSSNAQTSLKYLPAYCLEDEQAERNGRGKPTVKL